MENKKLKNIIQEFKTEIRKFIGSDLEKIFLFGSYARGDAVEGSDIDLLIVSNKKIPSSTMRKIRDVSNSLSLRYDVVISEFLFTEKDFKKHKTPFLLNVKREGILV